MKKIIYLLLATITISNSSFCQETEFKFKIEGFTNFVVTQCEGKTQAELYKKALDWVSVTYKNPKEVIKAQIENEYIRIEGSSKDIICMNAMGKNYFDAKYQIEISFKDGKYKFDIIEIEQFAANQWRNLNLTDLSVFFDKNGNIKNMYKCFPETLTNYFNQLNLNLNNFLNNKESTKKNEW